MGTPARLRAGSGWILILLFLCAAVLLSYRLANSGVPGPGSSLLPTLALVLALLLLAAAVVLDTSRRRRAEQVLRQLSSAVEQTADSVLITDRNGVIQYVNPAFEALTRYRKDEVVGLTPRILKSGRHDQEFYRNLWETVLAGEAFRAEFLNKKKNGELYHEEKTITPIRDSSAAITHFVSTGRDLTFRKRAEEALRHQAQIIGQIHDSVISTDLEGIITFWNRGSERLFGYSPVEAIGRNVSFLYPRNPADFGLPEVGRSMRERGTYEFESRMTKMSGDEFDARISLSYLRDASGEPVGFIGYTKDISEQKRAEEQLRAYEEQLRSLASQLSLVEERERRRIAVELHDRIGQALAISRIKLDMLRASSGSGVAGQIEEIRGLVDQTIQDTRSLSFELSPPVLYDLGLEAAIEWLGSQIEQQHKIRVTLESDHQSSQPEEALRVLLFTAVRELLVNIVKHAGAASVTISIRRRDNEIVVSVADDGVGFDVGKAHVGRTGGFGLFSIRERLHGLGGRLVVDSRPGSGTKATLVAPLQQKAVTAMEEAT